MKTKAIFITLFLFLMFQFVSATPLEDGMAAYYQKSWREAKESFGKAMQGNPNDSLALTYYIVACYWEGSFDHEMRGLEDHLVDYPDDQKAQIRLAFFHYTQAFTRGNDPRSSLTELRQAALKGPSAIVHTGIGIVYYDLGDLNRAQRELARAMDMNPKDALAYEYAGKILLLFSQDPTGSLNYFHKEVALVPDYPDGHYYMGTALEKLGQANNAIAEFEKAVALDPLDVGRGTDARVALGDLYLKVGQYDQAEKVYRKALELDPQSKMLQQRIADAEKQRKTK